MDHGITLSGSLLCQWGNITLIIAAFTILLVLTLVYVIVDDLAITNNESNPEVIDFPGNKYRRGYLKGK